MVRRRWRRLREIKPNDTLRFGGGCPCPWVNIPGPQSRYFLFHFDPAAGNLRFSTISCSSVYNLIHRLFYPHHTHEALPPSLHQPWAFLLSKISFNPPILNSFPFNTSSSSPSPYLPTHPLINQSPTDHAWLHQRRRPRDIFFLSFFLKTNKRKPALLLNRISKIPYLTLLTNQIPSLFSSCFPRYERWCDGYVWLLFETMEDILFGDVEGFGGMWER